MRSRPSPPSAARPARAPTAAHRRGARPPPVHAAARAGQASAAVEAGVVEAAGLPGAWEEMAAPDPAEDLNAPRHLPHGFGHVVPTSQRQAWDAAIFLRAYEAACEEAEVPFVPVAEARLAYLARHTYPHSGCPTLQAFAVQRLECDLYNN